MKTFKITIEQKSTWETYIVAPEDYDEEKIQKLIDHLGLVWDAVDDESFWDCEITVSWEDPPKGETSDLTLEKFKEGYLYSEET